MINILSAYSSPSEKKLELKISGGLGYLEGGDWNASEKGWEDYNRKNMDFLGGSSTGEYQELHLKTEMRGDFILYLNPRFGISAGIGYISSRVGEDSSKLITTLGETTTTNTIGMKISAIPVNIGICYYFPLFSKARLCIGAGTGYYFANFSRDYRRENNTGYWIDTEMDGKGSGIGFSGEIGLEYALSESIALMFETNGKYAKISGFEGTRDRVDSNNWSDSLQGSFYYSKRERPPHGWFPAVNIDTMTPAGPDVCDVREAQVDFSGFSIRLGLKIRLF